MARGPEVGAQRLSKDEHLAQLKQERAQKDQVRAEAKDLKAGQALYEKEWKIAEKRERAKEGKEKREKFFNDLKASGENTWKKVVGLGPKTVDFMKTKATQSQDTLDSLVAGARYVKQELPHKVQDYKEKHDIKKGQKLYEKEFKKADARMEAKQKFETQLKKKAFEQLHKASAKAEAREQAEKRKEAWKGKVDSAKEWGVQKVAEVTAKGRDIKHTRWDVPINNIKVKRVNNRLAREQKNLRNEVGMNAQEIALLMDRVNELKTRNRSLDEQRKFLANSAVERGRVDAVIGTADLSKKAEWMTQGNADLKNLFTMRSAS